MDRKIQRSQICNSNTYLSDHFGGWRQPEFLSKTSQFIPQTWTRILSDTTVPVTLGIRGRKRYTQVISFRNSVFVTGRVAGWHGSYRVLSKQEYLNPDAHVWFGLLTSTSGWPGEVIRSAGRCIVGGGRNIGRLQLSNNFLVGMPFRELQNLLGGIGTAALPRCTGGGQSSTGCRREV